MIKIIDSKKFLKDNDIKFYSYWTQKKLVDVVKEHGLYPEEKIKKKKRIKKEMKIKFLIMKD